MSDLPLLDVIAHREAQASAACARVVHGQTRLEREFLAFHRENPHVWELFQRFALDAIRSGRRHYSARAIVHRIRWHYEVETARTDDFKINNNHSPYYARLFAERHPEHARFFEYRRVRGED